MQQSHLTYCEMHCAMSSLSKFEVRFCYHSCTIANQANCILLEHSKIDRKTKTLETYNEGNFTLPTDRTLF